MQKVVGSNPISRFFENALHVGGLVSVRVAEIKWNHPRISPPFWALVPKMMRMARISGDFGRFRLALVPRARSGRTARYPCPMAQERITVDPNRMRGLP